ncbi:MULTISPECIES: HAD family hydrolase [Microbacterium]|uniref:Pyrimidine 5'-nucleotidase YjjG n=1 Tax=Microbacterium oxydans TaxID=82380 RepID=A0A3Q9J1S6_9MICO|nr:MULTISPECIES: HAD family hydrolase [Microbacterium]AZS38898.1 Pyrimidine 5'-nucleotidase YjjG [Microbacterium oxydans]
MNTIPRCPYTRPASTHALTHLPVAVTFDLDDTLYPQSSWLEGAWQDVAQTAQSAFDVPAEVGFPRLMAVSAEGSARGGIIDTAFPELDPDQLTALVSAFHQYRASELEPYVGAVAILRGLRSRGVSTALITDGAPAGQHNKIDALGIRSLFDVITISDEHGRAYRKPHELPFLETARALDIPPARILHIGDRWDKDVKGAENAGYLGCLRVHTGEYGHVPCQADGKGTRCVRDLAGAAALLFT